MNVVMLPATFSPDLVAAIKAENPGALVIVHVPTAEGAPIAHATSATGSTLATILGIIKPFVVAGATLYVPAPFGVLVARAISGGIDQVLAKVTGKPAKTWTVDEMEAEAASLPVPS